MAHVDRRRQRQPIKDPSDQGLPHSHGGSNGVLVSWGSGEFGQHGHSDTKRDIDFLNGHFKDVTIQGRTKLTACGSSHSIVITDSDDIFTWGNGTTGQLACPDWNSRLTPFKVELDPPPDEDVIVRQVACGSRHTVVLLSNGRVHAFGNNFFAQLGYDFRKEKYKENQSEPKALSFFDHMDVCQVACGDKHTMVRFQDGTVAVFGNNAHGQIGDGTRVESVVPKLVDLEAKVRYIACGSHHNLVLIDDGDVYVWGYCKACGHRRHDVLTPQLKVKGRNIIQVAGGGTHSLALTASGQILSWGYGADGQLGLGDVILSTARPRTVRQQHLWGNVSFIACAEAYSGAVTADGDLYLWGKNSHTIRCTEPANKSYFYPVCVNRNEAGQQVTSVHSVCCGTWHALALSGTPDHRPVVDENENDISDDEDDDDDDGGGDNDVNDSDDSDTRSMSSSSSSSKRAIGNSTGQRLETSSAPSGSRGPSDRNDRNEPPSPIMHPPPPGPRVSKAARMSTRLTLEEFYTLSDSSPSQDSQHASPRSQSEGKKSAPSPSTTCSVSSPHSTDETKHGHVERQQKSTESSATADVPATDREPTHPGTARMPTVSTNALCPDIVFSSPSPTSEISGISESSLMKRMAENLSRTGGDFSFRNRDWSGGRRSNTIISPVKPIVNLSIVTGGSAHPIPAGSHSPNPNNNHHNNSMTPKAASRTRAASLTERANTMFISKSTADHFYLPREHSIVTKQCVSLMDFDNLRSGTVFDTIDDNNNNINNDNNNNSNNNSNNVYSRGPSALHALGTSNSSSRLDNVLSPGQEYELNEEWFSRNSEMTKGGHPMMMTMMSASDTPSTMLRSARMHEMAGDVMMEGFPGGMKRPSHLGQHQPVMFNTPSPNFGGAPKNEDYPFNMPLLRSRTVFGSSQRGPSKFYRKPGLPRTTRPKLPIPGYLPSPRQNTFAGTFSNETSDRPADFSKRHSRATGLELISTSGRLRGIQSQPELRPHPSGQGEITPRRSVHTSSGAPWRAARQNTSIITTTKPVLRDASAFPRSHTLVGKTSFESDAVLMIGARKDPSSVPSKLIGELRTGPSSLRPHHYPNTGPVTRTADLKLKGKKKS